jgi:hypothetical protein
LRRARPLCWMVAYGRAPGAPPPSRRQPGARYLVRRTCGPTHRTYILQSIPERTAAALTGRPSWQRQRGDPAIRLWRVPYYPWHPGSTRLSGTLTGAGRQSDVHRRCTPQHAGEYAPVAAKPSRCATIHRHAQYGRDGDGCMGYSGISLHAAIARREADIYVYSPGLT